MFAKLTAYLFTLSAVVIGVMSTPVAYSGTKDLVARGSFSFNHWGGHASLDNFDNFYGVDNFDGSVHFNQVIESENRLVCHAQAIEIIQQRLVVLQEMAKRIITEQICEVETQTVVFKQFHASFGNFGHDIRRLSGHRVGYDSAIISHFGDIVGSDGSLSTHDFGFTGHDIGSHTVIVGGSNWDDFRSPFNVELAHRAARDAVISLQ